MTKRTYLKQELAKEWINAIKLLEPQDLIVELDKHGLNTKGNIGVLQNRLLRF